MIACQQPDAQDIFQSPHDAHRSALPESIRVAIDAETSDIIRAAQEEPVELT